MSFFAAIVMGNVGLGIIILVLSVILLVSLVLNIVNLCAIRKLKKKYEKKYQGKELEFKLKQAMYQKGFRISE